ncbi:class I SAM-dependent methyltransferase [Phycicoccus sp. HDW14]|uniref:class I SAM-dependent methyltransferase n=1 Tax=Phycicoccus sp. HDW14 TaxID=2714941 RepID=UPI001409869C|nr:class I SAM-dependent methyltransferase [Phycicoccus sp. HDW14]QIM21567.1 class I SAM-dependent methyltransferase [Phycicoccus sp. HDW14]
MTSSDHVTPPAPFEEHAVRGRFNALFFRVMGGYLDRRMRHHKWAVLAGLPDTVVELGPGVGANLPYLASGSRLIAIEPNPHMHARLRHAARAHGVDLEVRGVVAERIDLPDHSVDAVISSLVLCSVRDPEAVLAEVRRILRPGGRFSFAEHVVADPGTLTRWTQRAVRRPWAWVFEGCSCERDLAGAVEGAGFRSVDLRRYRIRSAFLPFTTHVAGTAVA